MTERRLGEVIRDQKPLILPPTASVAEACAAMHRRRVGAVLVADRDNRLLGIFTGRDAVRLLAENADATTRLDAAMTRDPACLGPDATAIDALQTFDDAGFRHLPITTQGRILGIVSRYDFRAREHARMDERTGFLEILR